MATQIKIIESSSAEDLERKVKHWVEQGINRPILDPNTIGQIGSFCHHELKFPDAHTCVILYQDYDKRPDLPD
ncbi:MAG: hypothetical protein OXI27_07450 [Thaumarchaeota archaeon]|nr:hypothetical protein [Nitrososphaerota archaeon]